MPYLVFGKPARKFIKKTGVQTNCWTLTHKLELAAVGEITFIGLAESILNILNPENGLWTKQVATASNP
jgi:hypothetical protein